MWRILCGTMVAIGLTAAVLAGGAARAGAAPAPVFAADLTDDGSCTFTLRATWKNAKVDHVFGSWNLDGAFLLTTEAPSTGPNGGTMMGRRATMQAGAFAASASPHTWQVLVQFYNGGAFVAEVWTNVDTASCAVAQP
jgi:hypothetical protein